MAMEKKGLKLKKDNKGVSLVEILVTIAMVVILVGPLLNSFLNSRGVNSNARLIQNGTTVAQDMAEKFKNIPIEELVATYTSYDLDETTGVYTFNDIEVDGPNGEKFLVDVTLDPTAYEQGNTDNRSPVNNELLPSMSSIYGSNCIKLYKYYTAVDEKLDELFASSVNNSSITNNIYGSTYRKGLSKDTTITVTSRYNSNAHRYEYYVELNMTYTFKYRQGYRNYTKTQSHREIIEDISFVENEDHLIYLICPIFDVYNTNARGYCSDKINIIYNFDNINGGTKPNLYFFLAQQDAYRRDTNGQETNTLQKIDPANVIVAGTDLRLYDSAGTHKLILCTNVDEPDGITIPDLTYEFRESGVSLYEMKVEVSLKGRDKVVAEFISTK